MDYIEIDDAIGRGGLRLVLTAGVPGPWSESAKGILKVKKIPYAPVRQNAGLAFETKQAFVGSQAPERVGLEPVEVVLGLSACTEHNNCRWGRRKTEEAR